MLYSSSHSKSRICRRITIIIIIIIIIINYICGIFIIEVYCNCTFFLPLNVILYIIIFYNVLLWSTSLHC